MNLDRDDVVDKLMHLSIETRELIENCEKATEETKLYKSKSEILEEEVRRISEENDTLKRENQNLRDQLKNNSLDEENWVSIVKNANQELNNVTPNVAKIFEKLQAQENARIQLERELVALKEENAKLLMIIDEKNALASKQNLDFLNIKKMVDDYQSEVARLDAELKHCHSRVSTLNDNLELINAENIDLAEYTNFKCLLKKIGATAKEDINEVFVNLQSLYKVEEELLDKKLSSHVSPLTTIDCDQFSQLHDSSDKLEQQNVELKDDLKECDQQIKNEDFFSSVIDKVEMAGGSLTNKLEKVSQDLLCLQSDLNATVDAKNQYKESVRLHLQSIFKIAQDLKASREVLSNLVKTLISDFAQFNLTMRQDVQEAIAHVKSSITLSNEEVIKEMQEVNLELKKRSETIFVLNQRIDELAKENGNLAQSMEERDKLVKNLNNQICDQQTVIAEKESQINTINCEIEKRNAELSNLTEILENTKVLLQSKDETISALENEISKAKDNQTADGDVSSMGNISRTEEVSRLRDVEDSFEERYMKLRCLAVKMKKNIADLNQQLKNEKSEHAAIQSKFNIAIEQAKRNQVLQEECDRINDELELKMKEITELKKIIVEADKKGEKTESLTKQCEILSTQKNDLQKEMNNMNSLVDQLKKEKFAEETVKKEMEKEVQRLKQKVKENEDTLKKVQSDLEQANLEVRKRGTLTLEMRDYEKTILDLNEKLKSKNATVEELNEKVRSTVESNVSLVERIKGLEEQISSFGASSKIAYEQILNLNGIISAHEKDLETKNNTLKQLKRNVEEEKSQNGSLTLQLAELTVEMNSVKERLKNIQESSNNQLKISQCRIKSLEEQLKKKEIEFEKLKDDFEAYKIRAHNALQKHKNENHLNNNEENFKTKIEDLSQTVKELRKRLDNTLADLDNHKTELKLLKASKEKLHTRMKEIQDASAEKTKELDNINIEFKSYKLNNETMMKCCKNEIERLRVSCQELEAQLEEEKSLKKYEIAHERRKSVAALDEKKDDDVLPDKFDNSEHFKDKKTLPENNKEKVRKKSRSHELVSLEKLLKSDIMEEQPGSESNAVAEDIVELRKNIEKLENQVTYLNGILNESEKNAARSEQHVAWLKDVNRRLQKTIDRAPHLQNGEYLKNVLFNFLTFPDGDEKCKLITILETLLQLTPEERGILSAIAKGDRSEQKRSSGFASFLKFG